MSFVPLVGLGRGFEPLGKGLKPFALAGLCHSSGPFLGLKVVGGALFTVQLVTPFGGGGRACSIGPTFPVLSYWGEYCIDRNRPGLLRSELRSRRTVNR